MTLWSRRKNQSDDGGAVLRRSEGEPQGAKNHQHQGELWVELWEEHEGGEGGGVGEEKGRSWDHYSMYQEQLCSTGNQKLAKASQLTCH